MTLSTTSRKPGTASMALRRTASGLAWAGVALALCAAAAMAVGSLEAAWARHGVCAVWGILAVAFLLTNAERLPGTTLPHAHSPGVWRAPPDGHSYGGSSLFVVPSPGQQGLMVVAFGLAGAGLMVLQPRPGGPASYVEPLVTLGLVVVLFPILCVIFAVPGWLTARRAEPAKAPRGRKGTAGAPLCPRCRSDAVDGLQPVHSSTSARCLDCGHEFEWECR